MDSVMEGPKQLEKNFGASLTTAIQGVEGNAVGNYSGFYIKSVIPPSPLP